GQLLSSPIVGIGSSSAGTVADFPAVADGIAAGSRYALDGPLNTKASLVHVWPYDGARGVPTAWRLRELPDPLAHYKGSHSVGPAIYVIGEIPATVKLRPATGGAPIPLVPVGAARSVATGSAK